MRAEYINPFVTSTHSVFQTMLNCTPTRGEIYLKTDHQPEFEVCGIIGLSGVGAGTVVLSLDREVALRVAQTMLMLPEKPAEIDADVRDAVGELANMVAGGAKAQLEALHMSVSIPTVIVGSYTVDFPSKFPPLCIPFTTPWGPMTVEVGLVTKDD